jgi:hypothetical protein
LTVALLVAAVGFFDAQAREPRLNFQTFVGGSAPDAAISVLYDADAFNQNGTERWTTLGQGQELQISANWGIGIWDGYITDVFMGHIRNPETDKVSDLFSPWADHEWPSEGEPAPRGVDPGGGFGALTGGGAFHSIGTSGQPLTAFKTIKTDELPQTEKAQIIAACNSQANAANDFRILHQYSVFMRVYAREWRRKKVNYWDSCVPSPSSASLCNEYAGYGASRFFTISGVVPISIQCNPPGSPQQGLAKKPDITNSSLSIKTSGDSCPKQAEATVMVFADGERNVRYRIHHQFEEYASPWFEGQIKETQILGGKGYASVADHKLERKLGPGEKKFRLQIEGNKSKWETVTVACPPLEAKNIVLSVTGSGEGVVCPRDTETEIAARTNGPGTITFHLRPVGGVSSAAYKRMAEREGDAYFARYKAQNKVHADIDKTYEAAVQGGPVSNKARLTVSCIKPTSGQLTLRKKIGSECEAEALVAIHTNVAGELPYELECGAGKSWKRTVQAPAANRIGIDTVGFAVTDKERVTCILRSRLGGELKSLGGASQTFECPTLAAPPP